jgi:hypothetical protein
MLDGSVTFSGEAIRSLILIVAQQRRFKHSASRGAAAIVATILITPAGMSLAAAENDCKTSFFGLCTNRFTESEQAQINARRWLEAQLRDPARSGPVLEQRLRKQVRYSNGLLLITDPILHGVTTLPATATWTTIKRAAQIVDRVFCTIFGAGNGRGRRLNGTVG